MRKKHCYTVIINGGCRGNAAVFRLDYSNIKGIAIQIAKNKANIEFETASEKSEEDFLNCQFDLLKHSLGKCYLLHACSFSCGLVINHIKVLKDHYTVIVDTDCGQNGYSIMYSMLSNTNLHLKDSWKDICDVLVEKTKTQMNRDTRYSAVYSYLLSKTRDYEYDKFQNLWTSINAIYSYVAQSFKENYKKEPQSNKKINSLNSDSTFIGLMSYLLCGNYKIITKNEADKHSITYLNIQTELCKLTDSNSLEILYDDLYYARNIIDSTNIDEKYKKIMELISPFQVSAFVFIVLGYAYYWRCKYFHGNIISPLFMAAKDNDLQVLRLLNFFLDRFLNDFIPTLFKDNFWSDDKYANAKNYLNLL